MKHALLMSEFLSTPWAMRPESLRVFAGVLHRWQKGMPMSDTTLTTVQADQSVRAARTQATQKASGGGIAVLPLYGVLTQRGNMVDALSGPGSTSTQMFTAALQDALADEAVGQILIDIDSPGGSVYGVAELASEILNARSRKPVVAIANSLAASAAYWAGSAATEFYCTPGGEVGSIGVWQAHEDISGALLYEGIDVTLISAGKYKVEGNPYEPLTEEATAFLQSRVDEYYSVFVESVATARGVTTDAVIQGMGQGRVVGAAAAVSLGMVDGVMSFDQVIGLMQSRVKSKTSRLSQARNVLALL